MRKSSQISAARVHKIVKDGSLDRCRKDSWGDFADGLDEEMKSIGVGGKREHGYKVDLQSNE